MAYFGQERSQRALHLAGVIDFLVDRLNTIFHFELA